MAARELQEQMQDSVFHFRKERYTTVSATKHCYGALHMLSVYWKFVRREDEVTKEQRRGA